MAITVQHGPSTGAYAMPMYKAGRNLEQYERVQNFIKQLLQKYGVDAPIESREKMQQEQLKLSREELQQMRELETARQQLQSRSLSQQQQIAMAELAARQNMASQQASLARLPYQMEREKANRLATNLGYGNITYGAYGSPSYSPVGGGGRGRSMAAMIARGRA